MATTIAPTQLTTTVQETITLNGVTFNSVNTRVVESVTNYVNSIFNIASGTQTIMEFARSGVAPRNNEYDIDNVKYIRLTNADTALDVKIIMQYSSSADQFVMLKAGASFVLADFTQASGDTLDAIQITTTADIDITYAIGVVS